MACYDFFGRFKQFMNNKYCRRAIIVFFLFLLFFCIGKCSSYAVSEVSYTDVIANTTFSSSGVVGSSDTLSLYVYDLQKYHSYTFSNDTGHTRTFGFSSDDTVGLGDVLFGITTLSSGDEYSFVVNDDNVKLLVLRVPSNTGNTRVYLYDNGVYSEDMSSSLDKLINNIDVWSAFRDSLPMIFVVVTVGLGFVFVRFLIRRVKR